MKYDVDYFFEKFSGIPARLWCTGTYENQGRHCAAGHCGEGAGSGWTRESKALNRLFVRFSGQVADTNDGHSAYPYGNNIGQGRKTPSGRILAALRWIKKQEAKA